MPAPIPFIGMTYTDRSPNVDAERTVNLYAEIVESRQGKVPVKLHSMPGLALKQTLPGVGGIRGMHTVPSVSRCFAVLGSTLYEILTATTATSRGTLATSSGPVVMADNGLHLVVADGHSGYTLTLATNTGGLWGRDTTHVAFLDGYFLFLERSTGRFGITNLYGTAIDATDVATAEGRPDLLVGLLTDHRDAWLAGQHTTEVWLNTGHPDFPFERMQGAFLELGVLAPYSLITLDQTTYFVGQTQHGRGMVYRAQGYQPLRISTHAVEQALQADPDLPNAQAYGHEREGHHWYTISTSTQTWRFDAATGWWSELAERDPLTGLLLRYRGQAHAQAFGLHLIGDYRNGNLYEERFDVGTYAGDPIVRVRQSPHSVVPSLNFVYEHAFQLDLQTGIGDGTGTAPGTDPQVMYQTSSDGGHTWSNERWASAGKQGDYTARVLFRRNGRFRSRVRRVTITAPVPDVVLLGATIDAEEGTA